MSSKLMNSITLVLSNRKMQSIKTLTINSNKTSNRNLKTLMKMTEDRISSMVNHNSSQLIIKQFRRIIIFRPLHKNQSTSRFNIIFDNVQKKDSVQQYRQSNAQDERSIQVVKFLPNDNKFELNQDAIDFLSQVEGNIGFVVVCGKYRTGKSFLLNRLLEVQGEGFRVEATTSSCTQGIWMYTKPIYNALNDLKIFFLDSEGSESIERSATHDSKIFALAILMSSYFVFNSVGCIDEQSISQLQLTTTLAKNIQVQETHSQNDQSGLGNESLLGYYTPKFLWILRDFVLEVQDRFGKKVNSKTYLENALNDESVQSKTMDVNKKIRKSLLQFFKERECVTMVRPVNDESDLKQLNKLPAQKLRQEFTLQLTQLRETLVSQCTPKQLNGVNLNGRMFCEMVSNYVKVLNQGGIPNIATAWEHIVESECINAHDKATELYRNLLQENFGQDEAKSFEELFQSLKVIRDQSYEKFHTLAGIREKNNYYEYYKQSLKDFMNEREALAIKLNEDMNRSKNEELVNILSQDLQNNLQGEVYTADDLEAFFSDFTSFLTAYDNQAGGSNKADTLIRFLIDFHPNLIKRLIHSIKRRYDKAGQNGQLDKAMFDEKAKNYKNNISVLEEKIAGHEVKIRKLDQEKLQLEQQKNNHQSQLEKVQKENEAINKNMKNVHQLQEQLREKDQEIMTLKTQIQQAQQKKKKGCCG